MLSAESPAIASEPPMASAAHRQYNLAPVLNFSSGGWDKVGSPGWMGVV
jgi:hypothetical protein